ncbi:hypothetical protein D3C75_560550 [compost metagenome]
MKIRLNPECVEQLTWIMERMGYTNPTHLVQVMISSTYNKLNKNVNTHKSPTSEDTHGNQSSKRM